MTINDKIIFGAFHGLLPFCGALYRSVVHCSKITPHLMSNEEFLVTEGKLIIHLFAI